MSNILFHPQISGLEAQRIAESQGGKIVWFGDRVRLREVMRLHELASAALDANNYEAALVNLSAAHGELFRGGALCVD